jgi:hypothetical protein
LNADAASVIDLLITALGGRPAVDAAVAQTITAEGWRRHPAWGTEPGKAEAVARFTYTLIEDAVRPRYHSMPAPGAQRGRLATQLYDAITSRGRDVEIVVGGHRGSDSKTWAHAAPLSYLKTTAGY